MADRRNQLTLGVLVSTFVYTILVSRWLRSELEDGSAFVPRVAVLVALGLALTNVFLLISFLHHMAASTRVGAIIDTAATKFRQVARASFEEVPDTTTDAAVPGGGWVVASTRGGYVGAVGLARLVTAARVFWRPASLGDLIDAPFEQCEPYLPADHTVLGALLSMAWKIEAANHHPEFAGRALGHAKRIVAFARDNLSSLQADALEEIDARSRELFELSRTADAQERQRAAEESSTAR